jgi:hypothetical protein
MQVDDPLVHPFIEGGLVWVPGMLVQRDLILLFLTRPGLNQTKLSYQAAHRMDNHHPRWAIPPAIYYHFQTP